MSGQQPPSTDPTGMITRQKMKELMNKKCDVGVQTEKTEKTEQEDTVSDTHSEASDSESDPDYDPNDSDMEEEEDEYEEDEDDVEEGEIGDDLIMNQQLVLIIPSGNVHSAVQIQRAPAIPFEDSEPESDFERRSPPRKRLRNEEMEFIRYFTKDERSYWKTLTEEEKARMINMDNTIKRADFNGAMPMRFKFLSSDIDNASKALILAKLDQFQQMNEGSGEYYKLRNWLHGAARLPLGRYKPLPVQPSDTVSKIASFLQHVRTSLDNTVFGHTETKEQIMRIMAQWVSNPDARGHCIGIYGAPGVGKTKFVKEGICKALNLPFGFVALGGASDGSFLEGHSFTYEGSMYGKIAEVLMKTQCMNPVFFFDELDKVSSTRRGEEIIGILTHLTDSTQNERFQDRYFGDLDLNLSKALVVFSYNDETLINPILKDRMITIHVKGYNVTEKVVIARDYLLPEIYAQYKLQKSDIVFSDEVIQYIIERVSPEEGVRNLKRGLEAIVSWMNMHRYIPPSDSAPVIFPVVITEEIVKKYLKQSASGYMQKEIQHAMYI